MAKVVIAPGGRLRIPSEIRKKYRIRSGVKVTVDDEQGVITIRPELKEAVRLAKRTLKTRKN